MTSVAPQPSSSPLGSVDKALLALDALADVGPGGVALGELAARLGLHKASLHRTLAALRFRGYVDQADGTYRLGAAALALGQAYYRFENLPALLRPLLEAVCAATAELVHLGALSGREIVYLDKVEPDRAVRVWSAVGKRSPAERTALGHAILAAMEPDDAVRSTWPGSSPAGGPDESSSRRDGDPAVEDVAEVSDQGRAASLGAELAAARRRGWAEEVGTNERGIACVAVPILRDDRPVAAVSVTAPIERMGPARRAKTGRLLRETAQRLLPAPLACGLGQGTRTPLG